MKRSSLPIVSTCGFILAAILPSAAANAQSFVNPFATDWRKDNYIQGNLGAVFDGNTHARGTAGPAPKGDSGQRAGLFASGLVGHEMGRGWALEGEVVYANSDIDARGSNGFLPANTKRSLDTYGGLVNLKYEMPTSWRVSSFPVSPYVAAGVGYGGATYDIGGRQADADGLLWQAKAGLAFHLNPRTTLDVGYRYLNGPQLEPQHDGSAFDSVNLSSHQHIASVGMRWRF